MLITLAAHEATHRLQNGDDDPQGPATPATTVSLQTCHRLKTAVDTEVVQKGPAGRAQN